jgi:glycosyltransferase involved in cell wall biosynthesis
MTFEGVFVVIPAYNEASVLSAVLRGLTRRVPRRQIILVDDGSLDATSQVAAQEHVVVLRHRLNRGQGAALATGIQAALELGAQAIVTFDADGQHQPDDMPALLEPILQGHAAVVLGSRFLAETTEVPRLRAWVLKMGVVFTQLISRVKISDVHNGLRAFSAAAARQIDLTEDRMAHASEFLDEIRRHHLPYAERPVHVSYTSYSRAKGQKSLAAVKLGLQILLHKLLFPKCTD